MAEFRVGREVLKGFREGDRVAFADVVRAYSSTVWNVVRGFWTSPFEQEEAMQEVWLKAYRQREALDPERLEQFAAWLAVMTRRTCIDLIRKQGRRPDLSRGAELEADFGAEPASQERAVEIAEVRIAVDGFRQRLKPKHKEFFDLHFVQGLDFEQIGNQLGVSRSRCKYLRRAVIGHAKRSPGLRAALAGLWKEGGSHAS